MLPGELPDWYRSMAAPALEAAAVAVASRAVMPALDGTALVAWLAITGLATAGAAVAAATRIRRRLLAGLRAGTS